MTRLLLAMLLAFAGLCPAQLRIDLSDPWQVEVIESYSEAPADAGVDLFGFERTRAISGKPAKEIAAAARAWGQNDDITVVTVRRQA